MDCVEAGAGAPPTLDALVVGTVALMTAWASPCPHARLAPEHLRRVLARKVVSLLFFLQHHPHARPELRQSMVQARAQWLALAADADVDACTEAAPGTPGSSLH